MTKPGSDSCASGGCPGHAGQVAIVTGAAGGIGQAVAAALARSGAVVVRADVRFESEDGPDGMWRALDVTDKVACTALVDEVLGRHGRIDILVNAAGVVAFGSAEQLDEAQWDRVLDINLKGTFLCCQAVMPVMRLQRYGRIVNLGSVVGKNGGNARPWIDPGEQQRAGNIAYGVSKAGVHAMTVFLARELATHGVTVNAVAPGPIATAMTTAFPAHLRAAIPVGRMGSVEDVARAVLYLTDRTTGFVNGEVLNVNGGMWCD